jgi:hypothetical protein
MAAILFLRFDRARPVYHHPAKPVPNTCKVYQPLFRKLYKLLAVCRNYWWKAGIQLSDDFRGDSNDNSEYERINVRARICERSQKIIGFPMRCQ